jgi:hypothetical protein
MECRIHQKETVGCGMQDTLKAHVSVAIYVGGEYCILVFTYKTVWVRVGG